MYALEKRDYKRNPRTPLATKIPSCSAEAEGFVYTSESGANIFSSNADAGTFIFNQSAASAGTRTVFQVKGTKTYESQTFYPAKLKNGVADPAYLVMITSM